MSPAVTFRRPGIAPVRRGFTLIELMIAMVVISILMAFLFVGVKGAMTNARRTQVVSEIRALEQGLERFKLAYGDYPPSRITLYETGTAWAGTGAEQVRSRSILRRFWSEINFAIDRDFNGDGDTSDTIELRGAECLAFFLGGMQKTGGPISARIGFSKNKLNPFDASGTSREGPFFEFVPTRILESTLVTGMPVYLDPLPSQTRPLIYISAYDGQGYDRNTAGTANRDATTDGLSASLSGERLTVGEYLQTATGPSWKDKSFQIISPGFDGQFGAGGEWNENTADSMLTGTRQAERDNITNFFSGTLATD